MIDRSKKEFIDFLKATCWRVHVPTESTDSASKPQHSQYREELSIRMRSLTNSTLTNRAK